MELQIIKTSNFFRRPKYTPAKIHNGWGVYNSKTKETLLRNVSYFKAARYIDELRQRKTS